MYYKSQSTLKRLAISREAIEIAKTDIHLSEVLTRFGINDEELNIGLGFQNSADVLHSRKDIEYGNQKIATEMLQSLFNEVRDQLRNDRLIVKVALGNRFGMARVLRLSTNLGRTYEEVASQAFHFYRGIKANEEAKALLLTYSMTDDVLDARIERVLSLTEAMKAQQVRVGEAQVTTAQFQRAMGLLDNWMSRFIGISRQAFKTEPKQLKKLGIHVKGNS